MKVALIGPVHPYRGGIAHYTSLLAFHLALRHEVHIVSFRKQYPSWLFPGQSDREPEQNFFIELRNIYYTIDPFNPLSWLHTAKLLRKLKPNVLIFQWWVTFWAPSFGSLLYLYRTVFPHSPIIAFCHNVMPHESHWWDKFLTKVILRFPTYCLVHSNQDAMSLLELAPKARVIVIDFPSYKRIIPASIYTMREARKLIGLDQDIHVLLFFGFVRPYKGLLYLLRAIYKVRQYIPVHLLVVGEFWEDKNRYLREIEALGLNSCVTIVDKYIPNSEVGKYFSAANVVILPYLQTSHSAVLRLSFDMGVPVIASEVGGIRESVVDGINGLLVKPGDSDSLAYAILRYFQEDLESKLRKNIMKEQTSADHQWEKIVRQIETICEAYSGSL